MSRKTHLWRIASPSIKERNAQLALTMEQAEFLNARVKALEHALIMLTKSDGSSMKDGEFRLTVTDDPVNYPQQWDMLEFQQGGQGEMIIVVRDTRLNDPDTVAMVAAVEEEMAHDRS